MILKIILYYALDTIITVVVLAGTIGTMLVVFGGFLGGMSNLRLDKEGRWGRIILWLCLVCLGLTVLGTITYSLLCKYGIDINEWSKTLLAP